MLCQDSYCLFIAFHRIGFVLKPPHGHGHGHSHGHSHDHNGHHAAESLNVRAAFVHVVGDLIFSLGLVIAAFIIKFKVKPLVNYVMPCNTSNYQ